MAPILHHPSIGPAGSGPTPTPLISADAALAVVRMAASEPLRPETVVLFLDDARVGRGCCIVSGTTAPDDILDVGALAAEVAGRSPDLHAVVLATMRPGRARATRAKVRPRARARHEDRALREAEVRPEGDARPADDARPEDDVRREAEVRSEGLDRPADDVRRWRALLELFDEVGVELLDWFVVGPPDDAHVVSLRACTGMPSQWRAT